MNMHSRIEQKFEDAGKQEIDLAPLLDVVFILLIFFIVTTVFVRETGIEVDKPTAISSKKLEKSVLLLAISHRGEVIYAGSNIGVKGVRSTLMHLIKKRERPLVIQADKKVSAELLVNVIDQAKLAGVSSVSIATVNE
ncbi:ExbD/TolR family protein [Teredinibacter purpureus]|jgi:outer membrane transport energization protein ExbD (TC 2.C.1.1.1)|uniref:ExbD/TolR family protein n=1 Tax=Teredinibacter purpureus TaxID=2731756 RepID=UPI000B0D30B1|nr:biopolymer transporter ExbD [Teredinibacter purpureus]